MPSTASTKTYQMVVLQEVFKSFANASRESILALPHLSDQEKKLIESIENLTSVCVLGFTSRKTWIVLFCVAWVSHSSDS